MRTDATVKQVMIRIIDSNPGNDDATTGNAHGNGGWIPATAVTPDASVGSEYPLEWRFQISQYSQRWYGGDSGATAGILQRHQYGFGTPTTAHVTEIIHTVNTAGPDLPFYFDWPAVDGTPVDAGFTARVLFAPALGNGYNDTELQNSFSVEIIPDGSSENQVVPRSEFVVQRDRGDSLGQLEFPIPALYDSDAPDRLYEIIVRQTSEGSLLSETSVKVTAIPVPPAPFIDIIEPEEVDVIGNRQDIIQPVVPTTPADRQQRIRVNTDETATGVEVRIDGKTASITSATNPVMTAADRLVWDFTWQIDAEGTYRITANMDTDGNPATVEAVDEITIRVEWLQLLTNNPADLDDDEDGIPDADEENNPGPPNSANSDTWTQNDIHREWALGRTLSLSPRFG